MKMIMLALAATTMAVPAWAQAPIVVNAPTAALRAGMAIPLKTSVDLTTNGKMLKVGQRVPLEVAEPVRLNGQIVIPAGTPGMGEITTVRNKGMWGKSGGITARVLYIRVGERQIRMSGTFDDKGKTGTAGVVAAAILIPVVGFFTTGTSAKIPLGSPVSAFLDEDVPVAMSNIAEAAPLQAQPSSPAIIPAVAQGQTVATVTPVALSK